MGYENFDIRILIQSLLSIKDPDSGEVVTSWINSKTIWAEEVDQVTGNNERLQSGVQIIATQKTVFEIRYIRKYKITLTPAKNRIVWDGQIYNLEEVQRIDGRKKYLRLVTERADNQGEAVTDTEIPTEVPTEPTPTETTTGDFDYYLESTHGTKNGINTDFYLNHNISAISKFKAHYNGMKLHPDNYQLITPNLFRTRFGDFAPSAEESLNVEYSI